MRLLAVQGPSCSLCLVNNILIGFITFRPIASRQNVEVIPIYHWPHVACIEQTAGQHNFTLLRTTLYTAAKRRPEASFRAQSCCPAALRGPMTFCQIPIIGDDASASVVERRALNRSPAFASSCFPRLLRRLPLGGFFHSDPCKSRRRSFAADFPRLRTSCCLSDKCVACCVNKSQTGTCRKRVH